jgi:hypothetical protein
MSIVVIHMIHVTYNTRRDLRHLRGVYALCIEYIGVFCVVSEYDLCGHVDGRW